MTLTQSDQFDQDLLNPITSNPHYTLTTKPAPAGGYAYHLVYHYSDESGEYFISNPFTTRDQALQAGHHRATAHVRRNYPQH